PGEIFSHLLAANIDSNSIAVHGIYFWVRQQIIDLSRDRVWTVEIIAAQPGQDASLAAAPALIDRVALPLIRFAEAVEARISFVFMENIQSLVCALRIDTPVFQVRVILAQHVFYRFADKLALVKGGRHDADQGKTTVPDYGWRQIPRLWIMLR